MKSVIGLTRAEYVEKKSRFIGLLHHAETTADVKELLTKAKQEYPDANHYTYAYILDDNQHKCIDDGEPSRTAGYPILEVIKAHELNHTLMIVIRYFGGTLLGSGGLIRAYSHTASLALSRATFVKKITTYYCKVTCDYDNLGNIDKIIREHTKLDNVDYSDTIDFYFYLNENNFEDIKVKLFNANNYQDNFVVIEETSDYPKTGY